MKYVISRPFEAIQDTIYIPSSKSISNRMLIIRALAGSAAKIENLSDSDDTRLLLKALKAHPSIIDVGHAGTAMRFLTAFLSTRPHQTVLTGSQRMKQRPIGPLVRALRELGARIEYLEKEGCPPLKISGEGIHGGNIQIDGGISSQFISALLMIGPVLPGGLQVSLKGEVVSSTYIRMTLELMKQCGVETVFDGKKITVPEKPYGMKSFTVESDWSSASYWYQMAAMLPGSDIELPNLYRESLQGDAVLVSLFEPLGVETRFTREGVEIKTRKRRRMELPARFDYDFTGCPDLVQTLAVTLCTLGVPFRFSGTQTLRVKETDRIDALQVELRKAGFVLQSDNFGKWIAWDGSLCKKSDNPVIQTYHDHRMAMAFAPLAIMLGRITIQDPRVVTKSYRGYWKDLRMAGFESPMCAINSEDPCDDGKTA